MNTIIRFAIATGLALMMSLPIMAAPPQTLNYQGYLTNPGGTPVNMPVAMTFRLYNAVSGGTALYMETQLSVNVANGGFNAVIGAVTPIPLPFDVPYWLSVAVNADAEMSPRQPLASSAYAFRAATLDAAATVSGAQITGSITTATLPATQITGTINAATAASAAALTGNVSGAQITGTISAANLAATQQLPAVACTANQVAKWNGSAWTCAADNVGGSVTSIVAGAGLSGGTITTSGTIAVDPASATLTGNFLQLGGNALGAPAVLGTTDAQPVVIKANAVQVMRYDATLPSPNISGGYLTNSAVGVGNGGATVAGGGSARADCFNIFSLSHNRDCGNHAGGEFSTVSGGKANSSGGYNSTVSGGESNDASGEDSAIGGGLGNRSSGIASFVGSGFYNGAFGIYSTVVSGSENFATGDYSSVPGGFRNRAQGRSSFAAGERANALHDNSFVWNGSTTNDSNSTAAGQFVVYAPGGVLLYAGAYGGGGCNLFNGVSGWACSSDRALKTNIRAIDPVSILQRLVAMPVTSWSMKSRPDLTQIGPMAQDFFAAFGLGDTDKMINTTNAQGVALAAIQGLNQLLNEKDIEIKYQAGRIEALEKMLSAIQTHLGIKSVH